MKKSKWRERERGFTRVAVRVFGGLDPLEVPHVSFDLFPKRILVTAKTCAIRSHFLQPWAENLWLDLLIKMILCRSVQVGTVAG